MAKKIVGIYMITCTANGKQYIGQSIDIKRRFTQHKTQTSNKNLKEDFERYGLDAFTFEILEECATEELIAREYYYLNTLKPEYNILMEGKPIFVSDRTREKQRQAKLGKKHTPEHCEKIRKSNRGKKMDYEACKKHFKAVRCVETGQIFESIQQAADFVGVKYNCISAVVHKRRQTSGGFHWEFVDKSKETQQSSVRKVNEKTRKKHCKSIRCVETGKVFEGVTVAARFVGVRQSNISAVLYGKQETAGGFHWEFVDAESKCNETVSKNLSRGRKGIKHSEETIEKLSIPVRCVETGKTFMSIKLAAANCGAKATNISKVLKGERQMAGGFHWEYIEKQFAQKNSRKARREGKPIICIETHKIFRTISDAVAHIGISHSSICNALHGRTKTAGGFHWEFVTD